MLLVQLPYIESDEAAFGACAARQLALSLLPLSQCVDVKPPGIVAVYELVYGLFGPYSSYGLRLTAALTMLGCASATYHLARLAKGKAVARTAAAIFILFASSSYFLLSLKTELIAILFIQIALICLVKFEQSARSALLVAAGLFVGVAIMFKQPAILFCGSLSVSLFILNRSSASIMTRVKPIFYFGASCLLFLITVAFVYYVAGNFEEFVQQTWHRPALYAAQGSDLPQAWRKLFQTPANLPLVSILTLTILAMSGLGVLIGGGSDRPAVGKPIAWWMVPSIACASFAIALGGRFFPSYFLFILPFFCILLGITAQPLFAAVARSRMWRLSAMLVCGLAGVFIFVSMANLRAVLAGGLSDSKVILAQAERGDKLYVWGYTPEFYVSTKMIPASRFVVTSLLVGHFFGEGNANPPMDQMKFVKPGDWDVFIRDLIQAKAFLFIDASRMRMGKPGDFAPLHYPRMKQFIDKNCAFKTNIGSMPLYRCVVEAS